MTYETEKEYQKKIDDLLDEIDDLADEAEDKGFSVKKRDEELDILPLELRASTFKTQDDCQKFIYKVQRERLEISMEITKLTSDINENGEKTKKMQVQRKQRQKRLDELTNELEDALKQAKANKWDVNERSEEFEERKKALLAELEERAPKRFTEKEFQDEVDYLRESIADFQKKLKKETNPKYIKTYEDSIKEIEQDIKKTIKQAAKQGFKVRSEELDFETRALETENDYQKELNKLYAEAQKLADDYASKNQEAKKLKWEADRVIVKAENLWNEAKKKGFSPKWKKIKFQRGEDMTFEARKKIVLEALEKRALNTEKDYQNEINDWMEQVEDRLEKSKDAEKSAKYWKNEAIQDYKSAEDLYKEGTKKGFKLKIKTFKF